MSAAAEKFVVNMQALREVHGWNQSELARRMIERGWEKYSQVTVKRTEGGERVARLDEALDLAAVLGVTLPMMLGERPGMVPDPIKHLLDDADEARNASYRAAARAERVYEQVHALVATAGVSDDGGRG